jgi:hypothetical protein
MSRAVATNEVSGCMLKIKKIQGSTYGDVITTLSSDNIDFNNNIATFKLDNTNDFTIGSFYKAQLAYTDTKKEVGYYSSVGVIKFTTKPEVSIANLSSSSNKHSYNYTGIYSQKNGDTTEKVYSYRFVLKEKEGKIIKDTGFIVHNSSNDIDYYES